MTAEKAFGSSEQQELPWWLALIEGVALLIVGLLFLTSPGMTTVVTVQILGLYWIFAGILSIVRIFIDSSNWGWKLIAGIVGILAGLLILRYPLWSSLILGNTLIIILGLAGIVIGIVNIVQAFRGAGWGSGILGVVSIILGIVLLANVWVFAFSLPLTLGILSLIGGIATIFGAFRLRSDQKLAKEAEVVPPPSEESAVEETKEADRVDEAITPVPDEVDQVTEETVEEPVPEIPDTAGEKSKFHQPLTYIEGIGPAYETTLNDMGIMNPLDLLEQGASKKGRLEIAEKTQITLKLISRWVNHVDLFRVPGIGNQYADLLEVAGVDTVPELAQRNAQNLQKKMVSVNEEKKLVRKVPSEQQVVDWVTQAKELPRKVTY